MSNKILYIIIGAAITIGVTGALFRVLVPMAQAPDDSNNVIACTAEAMQCPDGSYVGRSGPNCEFKCPEAEAIPADVQAQIDSKADLIKVTSPIPLGVVQSPLTLSGEARGNWFFEASAPVALVDWDGKIIAEGVITAGGEWMTTDFVPFKAELIFTSPYKPGDQDFMKRGALIFKKDNPSGLPENDNSLEIPVQFTK